MEKVKTKSFENLQLRKCHVRLNRIPESVIRSHLKNTFKKKKKTLKYEQQSKNTSLEDAYSCCVIKSEINVQPYKQVAINASLDTIPDVKSYEYLNQVIKQECESEGETEKYKGNKDVSDSKKEVIHKIDIFENVIEDKNFIKGESSVDEIEANIIHKLSKSIHTCEILNNVSDVDTSAVFRNSSLSEYKSFSNQPKSNNIAAKKFQPIGKIEENCQAIIERKHGENAINSVTNVKKELTKSLEKISIEEESLNNFCGFEKGDLHPKSKLWTTHYLDLILKEKVRQKYSNTMVKMELPKVKYKGREKSNNVSGSHNIEVSEKCIGNLLQSHNCKVKEKSDVIISKKLSTLDNDDKVKGKSNDVSIAPLPDSQSRSSIVKIENINDTAKENKDLKETSITGIDKCSTTTTIERPDGICKVNSNINKNEAFFKARNLETKKKHRIYNIPGISFIIGVKPDAFSKLKKNSYDCVICSFKEISSLFSGEEMKKHVQSRHHLMNVLRAENYSSYSLYKHDKEIANKTICSEILKYEEKHELQYLSVAKSKESHLMMRRVFRDRIKNLITAQENSGSKKSILDLISLDCQHSYLKAKNCNTQNYSFDTIVLVGDSRVDNLCIPQIGKSDGVPRVLHDSCKEAKIDTIINMVEKNLSNISSCKVLVIVLGFHFDIICSLLNEPQLTANIEPYLKAMISTINSASEKWEKSFPNCKFIWCFPCVPDFKRLNNITNSTGKVIYDENDTIELNKIRSYFKILKELKQLWKTCISRAMISLELDLNMVFSKHIHKRQKYFTSFTDESKFPLFVVKQTIDGFHFSPNVAKIFWRHILRRAQATDLMHILSSLPTNETANEDFNSLQISDDTNIVLSSCQTEEVSDEGLNMRQIKEGTNEILNLLPIKEATKDILNSLNNEKDANEVLNLIPNLVYDNHEISSFEEVSNSSIKYNKVTLIADHRYAPYLQQWKSSEILILDDEKFNIRDIEAFLISKKKLLTAKTLYLVVTGIHSFTVLVNSDFCKTNKCDQSSVLRAIQPVFFDKFNEFVSQHVFEINKALREAKVRLLNGSDIALMPPLPISLMPLCDDHKLLHDKHNIFPNYMIVNSKSGDLRAQYMFWMKKMTKFAWLHLSPHIDCRNLPHSLDEEYYKLDEMQCSSADKPSYNKWKDLVKHILNVALPCNYNISKLFETQMKPNLKFSGTESNLKGTIIETLENASQNISKSLSSCEQDLKEVAYDHLVLIGKSDSLKLLEDGFNFCTVAKWYLDEDFKFESSIDIIRKQGMKKVLFVFISDASMIGCKIPVVECIKHNCTQQLSFIGQSDKLDSLELNLKHNIVTLKLIMSQIEKLCDIQSQIIVAPFTPVFYVHISNIILFHSKMHDLLKHQNGISFVRGYSMKLWDDILKSFEVEWKKLSIEFSNNHIKEMESIIYDEKKLNWKILPLLVDSIDKVDTVMVSEWQTCVMSLILKGWSVTHPISVIENMCSIAASTSSTIIHQMPLMSNLIQVELNSETDDIEKPSEIILNDHSIPTASEINSCSVVNWIPPSILGALQEDTKNLSSDCFDDTNASVNSELDDVILFAKKILNSKQIMETCFKKYENAFIIGKLEILSKLSNLNINSTFIYEDFSKFVNGHEEIKSLMAQIYLKAGNFLGSFVCYLLFDISLIMESIGKKLPECLNRGCHKPLDVSALKAKYVSNPQTTDELDVFIADHLHNVKLFINKLSKFIPVVVLPLFPARIYCCDTASTSDDHQIDHQMGILGCTIVQGPKCLWINIFQSLIHTWNNLMKQNNLELNKNIYFDTYMSRKQNAFSFVDKDMVVTKNWIEPNVWKAFIDTFLSSVVLRKGRPKDIQMKAETAFYKKVDVSIMRVTPSVPFGFCEELFKSIDEKVVIVQEKGVCKLKDMIFIRAVLFAKKLNSFRVGDTILVAAIQGNKSKADEDISLMQDLYISSIIEKVYRKWKNSIIDNITKSLNKAPDVRTIKATPCEKGYGCKGLKLCAHFHNPTDKRRNPLLHKYIMQFCLKPQTIDGVCENGEQCLRCHNYYEEKFHPEEYQAKICSSGLPSELCNRQKLCMRAHKDSPEMFYVTEWEDLIVTDISNTINYFAGAIRGISKLKDMNHYNFRILLISSSSEFLDTAVKASSGLIEDFQLKVCILESEMMSNADSCEVIVGNPSLFISINPNIFLEMSGAIIVDDIHSILKDEKEKESLFQLFKNITSSSYTIMLNKVFVCDSYDTDATNAILRVTGSRLRHLHIEPPYKTDTRIENLSFQSSSPKRVFSQELIDKKISEVSRALRRRKILHDAKVRLTKCDSQSASKSLHQQDMPGNSCYLKSPPHKSRSRSKSLELDRKVVESVERNISMIRFADVRTGLEEQSKDKEILHSQTRPVESYKGDQLTAKDKFWLHVKNKKSQLKRNDNGTPLEVMSKFKYNFSTGSCYQSQDHDNSLRKQKRSRSKSIDRQFKKSVNTSIYSDNSSTRQIPMGRKRSRSRSVDKNNRSRSKSLNKHATSPRRLQKRSPLHRSRSRSVDKNNRSRSKSLNKHATSPRRIQKRSPLHCSRSRSRSLKLDKTSMLKSLQRCISQSLSKKSYKRLRMENKDNDIDQEFKKAKSSDRLEFMEQKLLDEKRNESKLVKFRRGETLPKDKNTLLSATISYQQGPQRSNFELSKSSERNMENKRMVANSNSDFKLIKAEEIEQLKPKSPAVDKLQTSVDEALSIPNCSRSDREQKLLGDFLIRNRLGVKLFEAYKTAVKKLQSAFEMEYTVYKNIPEVHPNYSDYYGTFTAKFIAQHGDSNDEIKEKLWKLFWDSKYDEIKDDDWKLKQRNLLKSFEQKVRMENAPLLNPILPMPQKELSSFVFKDALTHIEQLCENIAFLGPSVKSMIETCRSLGTTTKEAYGIFTESENVALVQLLMERFKTKSLEGPNDTQQLFIKALEWIPKILEEAKAGQTSIEDVKIDINSIAKISAGKGTDFTLNLIKIALAYEGFPNPPLEVVNEYFMKVCKVHFEVSTSRPK